MSKISELIAFAKKKFSRRKDDEYVDEILEEEGIDEEMAEDMDIKHPEGGRSMLKGDHGKIMGIDRNIVTGIFVFIFVLFAMAILYVSSGSDDKSGKENQPHTQQEIAGENSLRNSDTQGLSDDYGELERANQERLKKQGLANGQNANTVQAQPANGQHDTNQVRPATQTVRANPVVASSYREVPQIPASAPASYGATYSLPSNNSQSQENENKEKEQSIAQKLKDKLSSAIAFFEGKDKETTSAGGNSSQSAATASAGTASAGAVSTNPTYAQATPNTVTAGTIIPAMLMNGINTDTPGTVFAQVMGDVYNLEGSNVLIPAGSRLVGSVGTADGKSGRVNVTFSQIILPDGGAWNVGESFVAVDGAGYTGIKGKLHRHTGSNFMNGIWNSAMTALSTAAVSNVTIDASALTALTDKQKPTTTVDPGYQFNIYVTQNIQF